MTVTVGDHVLTDDQAEMLLAIYEFVHKQEQDTPTPLTPGIRDLAPMLGLKSTSMVRNRLVKLAEAGYLVRDPEWAGISRASTRMTYSGHHVAWTLFRENQLV